MQESADSRSHVFHNRFGIPSGLRIAFPPVQGPDAKTRSGGPPPPPAKSTPIHNIIIIIIITTAINKSQKLRSCKSEALDFYPREWRYTVYVYKQLLLMVNGK